MIDEQESKRSYLAEVDSGVLTGAQTKRRNIQGCQIDSFERNLLTHTIHHQLTIQ